MAYIDQVKIGSTTYEIHDKRLENPVIFGGIVPPAGSTSDYQQKWINLHIAATSDANAWVQWKIGTRGIIFKDDDQFYFYAVGTTLPSPASAYIKLQDVYPGDLVYFKGDSDPIANQEIEYVPSADNPHTHGAGTLSAATAGAHSHSVTAAGTLSTAGKHSHTVTASGTLSSDGSHSHTITLSGTTTTHSHSYVKATGVANGGAHTHSVSIPTLAVAVTGTGGSFAGTSVNTNEKGGHSHTITMASHRHSFTASGTLDTAGSHSHTFTGTAATHNHSVTAAGTLDSKGGHTHTVNKSITLNSGGAHTHGVSYVKLTPTVSGTVLQFTETTVNTEAVSAGGHSHTVNASITLDSAGSHSHTFTGSSVNVSTVTLTPAGTLNEKGGHSHNFVGTAGNTGYATSTGTMSTAGAHSHSVTAAGTITWPTYSGSIPAFDVEAASAGSHGHTLNTESATSGGTNLNLSATSTTGGSHSHTFTGTQVNTSEIAAHSHTFNGSSVNTNEKGGHVHSITGNTALGQ